MVVVVEGLVVVVVGLTVVVVVELVVELVDVVVTVVVTVVGDVDCLHATIATTVANRTTVPSLFTATPFWLGATC